MSDPSAAQEAATAKPLSIAIVTCSVRPQRVNPLIAAHIAAILQSHLATTTSPRPITLHAIDLATPDLLPPLVPPPGAATDTQIPAGQPKTATSAHYVDPVTRAWSAAVAAHDAFVFVTPQYNWGYPAALKHALDLLFWEWVGKAAWVVSYGGRGGGKSRAQLEGVLHGLRMNVVGEGDAPGGVELAISPVVGQQCVADGVLSPAVIAGWNDGGAEQKLAAGWAALLAAMSDDSSTKGAH